MFRNSFLAAVIISSAVAFSTPPIATNRLARLSVQRTDALFKKSGAAAASSRSPILGLRAQESIDDKTAGAVAAISFVALPVVLWSEFTLK